LGVVVSCIAVFALVVMKLLLVLSAELDLSLCLHLSSECGVNNHEPVFSSGTYYYIYFINDCLYCG
jgi:hypothetical protein